MDSYVNWLAVQMFAEISGMNAENNQRLTLGESMAYVESDFAEVSQRYQVLCDAHVEKSKEHK